MFIVRKFSVFNSQLAQTLTDKENTTFSANILLTNFDNSKNEDKLSLINIDTTDFDSMLSAEQVADQLVKQGLPISIKTIDLLIPNIQDRLPQFAGELARAVAQL